MRTVVSWAFFFALALALASACGSSPDATSRAPIDAALGEEAASEAGVLGDEGLSDGPEDATAEASAVEGGLAADGGDAGPPLAADRFVTGVVSFTPGACAGFGASEMPGIVEGPPQGGGTSIGGLDVVSLGVDGEIVLSFAPNAIVDGPGPDFIVFENPFDFGDDPKDVYAEPGEVSVSDDGTTWSTYPCTATTYPYGECAGWHPVLSSSANGISPVDPTVSGGDPFDLAEVGLTRARFVRIRDKTTEVCPDAGGLTTDGFDLDAIAIVNAQMP